MSQFVSGGSLDDPTERDEAWIQAQKELDEEHRRKAELESQQGGKSLYEVLEANKVAKQEAFEEKTKIKNQFRPLDDDEVEFLDSVLESSRAQEEAVKKETSQQLASFRKQQENMERAALTQDDGTRSPDEPQESWTATGRKRKKAKEKDGFKGLKLRKISFSEEKSVIYPTREENPGQASPPKHDTKKSESKDSVEEKKIIDPAPVAKPTSLAPLGLAGYSSDED